MRRPVALAALAVSATAFLAPVTSASACTGGADPACMAPCITVDHYYRQLQSLFADPIPKPVC